MTHRMITREPWKPGLGIWVLVGLAFCLPFGIGLLRQVRVHEGLDRWVAKDKNPDAFREEILKVFPERSQIILTWTESHIDDPRVELLAGKLRSKSDEDGVRRGGLKQLLQVESPRNTLQQLLAAGVPQEEAIERIRGHLIGAGDLRIRLSENGREQPEFVHRQLKEGAKKDLQLDLQILEPFKYEELPESAEAELESETDEAVAALPETLFSSDYDFRVRWEGMHKHPEEIEKFITWANGLSLPTVGAAEVGDSPIDECFVSAGSPAALVLTMSPAGEADPQDTLAQVKQAAESVGIRAEDLRLGGVPIIETSLQQAASEVLWNSRAGTPWYRRSSVLFSVVVLLGLTLWFVRSVKWASLLTLTGLSAVCMAIVVPAWNEPRIGLLSMLALLLVFGLGIVLALPWLHLEKLYVSKGTEDPSKTARLRSWFPCLLGAMCLLAGSLTIRSYSIPPIQEFALCLAMGIATMAMLVLYGLPMALSHFPLEACAESKETRRDWVHMGKLIVRRRYLIATSLSTLMIAAMIGIEGVKVENLFLTAFPDGSELQRNHQFIDERLSGTIPVEIVVAFEETALNEMDFRQRLELIRSVSKELRGVDVVTGAESLADLIPEPANEASEEGTEKLSRREKLKQNAAAEAFESELRERADFSEWCRVAKTASFAGGSAQREMWRVSAQARSTGSPEELIRQLDGACQTVTRYHPGVRHIAASSSVLSLGDLEELKDAAVVCIGGIVAISAAVLLILLHNPLAATMGLFPIFIGCVLPVGVACWMNRPIGPMHLIALPFVLGVNAFLTINLLAAFCYHLQNGRDRMAAAAEAFGDLAPVISHVYIILGAGFGVLGLAEFGIVSEFGSNALVYLATSCATSLIGIPSFCAGWIGLCFESHKRKSKRHSEIEKILEETLPQELEQEITVKHPAGKSKPKSDSNGRRRIDGGPKKIA